jgi:hypothetical protein
LYIVAKDELCYPLDYFKEMLNEETTEFILEEEELNKKADRYCTMYGDFLSDGDCGYKNCKSYQPQNGIRGRCVSKAFSYTKTGRTFRLTKDDFIEI